MDSGSSTVLPTNINSGSSIGYGKKTNIVYDLARNYY